MKDSSGAGVTTDKSTSAHIAERDKPTAVFVVGNGFHRQHLAVVQFDIARVNRTSRTRMLFDADDIVLER